VRIGIGLGVDVQSSQKRQAGAWIPRPARKPPFVILQVQGQDHSPLFDANTAGHGSRLIPRTMKSRQEQRGQESHQRDDDQKLDQSESLSMDGRGSRLRDWTSHSEIVALQLPRLPRRHIAFRHFLPKASPVGGFPKEAPPPLIQDRIIEAVIIKLFESQL
jgi:hypothetical protein